MIVRLCWQMIPSPLQRAIRRGHVAWLKLLHGETLPLTIDGRELMVAFDSAGHYSSIKNFSNYDPEFLSESKSHAAQARTIYDVGANIGLYSLAAVCCNPEVEVYSFEPEPPLASL